MSETAARETLSTLSNSELQELVVTGLKVRQYFECVNVALKEEIEQLEADKAALLECVTTLRFHIGGRGPEIPRSRKLGLIDACLNQIGGIPNEPTESSQG